MHMDKVNTVSKQIISTTALLTKKPTLSDSWFELNQDQNLITPQMSSEGLRTSGTQRNQEQDNKVTNQTSGAQLC